MCRNITELRGLDPPVTQEELEAAASQFLRKVTGLRRPGPDVSVLMSAATGEIADITARLLDELPARRRPPGTLPPLRRPEVRTRLGLDEAPVRGSPPGSVPASRT
jgi:hypothetical protein